MTDLTDFLLKGCRMLPRLLYYESESGRSGRSPLPCFIGFNHR